MSPWTCLGHGCFSEFPCFWWLWRSARGWGLCKMPRWWSLSGLFSWVDWGYGFQRSRHRSEVPFSSHRTTGSAVSVTVSVMLTVPTGWGGICQVSPLSSLFSHPLHPLLSGGTSLCAEHSRAWVCVLTPLRQSVCVNDLGFFCMGDCLFFSLTQFYQCGLMDVYFLLRVMIRYCFILLPRWFGHQELFPLALMSLRPVAILARCAFISCFVLGSVLLSTPHPPSHTQAQRAVCCHDSWYSSFTKIHSGAVRSVGEFSLSFNILLYII